MCGHALMVLGMRTFEEVFFFPPHSNLSPNLCGQDSFKSVWLIERGPRTRRTNQKSFGAWKVFCLPNLSSFLQRANDTIAEFSS